QEQSWDVVICDHNLPELDSSQALALVRQLQPQLPFIIVSGDFSEQATVEALAAGASDVVSKDKLARLAPCSGARCGKRGRSSDWRGWPIMTSLPDCPTRTGC